jgi:8-oxo-dGTP pyrophosphatase MutT (NUDIX family)
MTRQETILLLEHYLPADQQEQKFKKEMLAFMHAHENCFERSLEIGHITASSWLLSKQGDKALLTHHAKLNRWFQLGGHCDGDPNVLAVAIKEAQEESGIYDIAPLSTAIFDIDIHLIPAQPEDLSVEPSPPAMAHAAVLSDVVLTKSEALAQEEASVHRKVDRRRLENKKEKAHYHYDIRFLLQAQSDDAIQVSEESHALAWFGNDPASLPPVDKSVLRMFNKWVERKI